MDRWIRQIEGQIDGQMEGQTELKDRMNGT